MASYLQGGIAESLIIISCRGLVVVRVNETFSDLAALQMLWAKSSYATVEILVVALGAYFDIRVPALQIRGRGFSFAYGLTYMVGIGDIHYNSVETLLSAPNGFVVISAAVVGGFAIMRFDIGGTIVATMSFGTAGLGLGSVAGKLTWE